MSVFLIKVVIGAEFLVGKVVCWLSGKHLLGIGSKCWYCGKGVPWKEILGDPNDD